MKPARLCNKPIAQRVRRRHMENRANRPHRSKSSSNLRSQSRPFHVECVFKNDKGLFGPQSSSTAARTRASRSQTSTLCSCKNVSPVMLSETFRTSSPMKVTLTCHHAHIEPFRTGLDNHLLHNVHLPGFCESHGSDGVLCAIVAFPTFQLTSDERRVLCLPVLSATPP